MMVNEEKNSPPERAQSPRPAQHTPGPWAFVQGGDERDFIVAEPTGNTVCEPNVELYDFEWPLYDPNIHPISIEEAKANARLIAAAPDLLAACLYVKRFLATLERDSQRNGDPLNTARKRFHAPLHATLDAVIEKATAAGRGDSDRTVSARS